VHMGDNIVDLYEVPVDCVQEQIKNNRRMGIGPMGVADMFLKMNIRYGSQESLDLIDKIMTIWKEATVEASRELAVKRGPFPNWDKSIYCERNEPYRRNAALTNAAPTGSISR